MSDASLQETYLRLIQINQEAFAGSEYNVAYHALNGAVHCAVAVQQLAWIDAHEPGYEHSTPSSSERGFQAFTQIWQRWLTPKF